MKPSVLAASSLLSLLAVSATAALPTLNRVADLTWPTATPGTYSTTVACDFTLDHHRDLLVLRSGEACLLYGPDQYDAVTVLGDGVLDATVLVGAGLAGADRLALVGTNGVTVAWVDADHALQSSLLSGGVGVAVVSADIDQLAGPDLLVLEADHRTVRRWVASASAAAGYVDAGWFDLGATADALRVLDFDGDGADEVACLSAQGLVVRELDGSPCATFATSLPGDGLWVFSQAGVPALAWLRRTADLVAQELVVARSGGLEAPLALGALEVVALAAGDLDGDGADELVLSHRSSRQALVLRDRGAGVTGGSFALGAGDAQVVDLDVEAALPAPENEAQPALADFDNDGDQDVLFPVQARDACVRLVNSRIDRSAQEVRLLDGVYVQQAHIQSYLAGTPAQTAGGYSTSGHATTISGHGALALRLLPPVVAWDPALDQLEVVVWRQDDAAVSAERVAIERQRIALPAIWSAAAPLAVLVAVDEASLPFTAVYNVEWRLVALAGGDNVAAALPTGTGSFATDDDTLTELSAAAGNYASIPLYLPAVGGLQFAAVEAGGFIRHQSIPLVVLAPLPVPLPQAPIGS